MIPKVKLPVHRAVPPDNVDMITRSAFVSAHPAKAGQSSRLACKLELGERLSL